MNETIGEKGGRNDRIRTLRIEQQKKKKEELSEEEKIHELEKKVKRRQRFILIKVLPLVIAGGTIKMIYETASAKPKDKEEAYSKWRIKEYDQDHSVHTKREEKTKAKAQEVRPVIVSVDGKDVIVQVSYRDIPKTNDTELKPIETEEKEKRQDEMKEKTPSRDSEEPKFIPVSYQQAGLVSEKNSSDIESFHDFPTFDKLRSRRIIDEYEKQLKDIRFELRQLVFDYQVLAEEEEKIVFKKEAEILLERLSDVIFRIEKLKSKIRIENLDQYDDNYIYTLIEDYLAEFRDKKFVSEIKDSPLYVMISEKLEELDIKKDELNSKVSKKKESLEEKEENFERLKEKYYHFEKFQQELIDFQDEQDFLLREVKEKIQNSVSISEKIETQIHYMNRQSGRLLRTLAHSMSFPGLRSTRGILFTTAAYLYFARQILNPTITTKKYRVITVKDYSKDIEKNMNAMDDAVILLSKTDKQIDKMIREIREEYGDYIGVLKECDELLYNLEKVKRDLHEKEYEMEKMKEQQRILLEHNNAKVLTRGEYPM